LQGAMKEKWNEATMASEAELPTKFWQLSGEQVSLRASIRECQARCQETKELMSAQRKVLGATAKDPTKGLEEAAKDYRLSPDDQVLERKVSVGRADLWVPVLPDIAIPDGLEVVSWRRWAFDWSHGTFLDPHRKPGASWQTLKRVAYWPEIHKDFTIWVNACAVCHQYRTVGHLAPMRSIVSSIPEVARLPWADVIIDCQGPFTRSEKGNCYILSYHCTF
jgi:hypothetical protein